MRSSIEFLAGRTALIAGSLAAASFALAGDARAQAPQVLPGIVVQGATLEPPPARSPRPAPADDATDQAPSASDSGAAGAAGSGQGGDAATGLDGSRIGTSVSVVTRADLQAQQVRNGAEALRSLPGVSISRTGNFAGLTQVRIRGSEADHTLVLVDGIAANSGSDGQYDFSDLQTEDIERIEVIRGPQSALFGSNAIGGVINIITRGGQGPLTVTGRAEYGSFNTRDVAARVSGGNERAWGAVTVHRQSTSGFNIAPRGSLDENDGSRLTTISAKAGFKPAENIAIGFNFRRTDKQLARDDQTGLDSRGGFVIASDSSSRSQTMVELLGADLRWDMLGGALTHIFRANRNVTERNDFTSAYFPNFFPPPAASLAESNFNNRSEAYTYAYQATYRFATPMLLAARHSVTGLVEQETDSFTPGPDAGDRIKRTRSRVGTAAEWRGELFDRLNLSAGLRHDDNDSSPNSTTWRTTASLRLPEIGLRPHGSVGTAVKLPTQFEQFGAAANFVPNPKLKPEESFGWDAGVEFMVLAGKATLDVTYFQSDLQNKINTAFISMFDPARIMDCRPGDVFCSTSINLTGTSHRRGVETALRAELSPGLMLGLGYTWLDAVDNAGVREIRRPPHSGRADVSYTFDQKRANVTLAVAYNGRMSDTVFGAPFFFPTSTLDLDQYWLVTLAGSYKLQPGVELFGRIENLLNQKYEEIYGFNTQPIVAFAGVRFTFEDRPIREAAN